MTANPSAADWAHARGDKWLAHLSDMETMLAPVDEPLMQALHLDGPLRIAEIGCGGGRTTLRLARRAPPGSVVHGFDISPRLIEVAQKDAQGNAPSVELAVADMATASPKAPYDRLVSRFGVMFFDDEPLAFANLARWLKTGGRFAFAVWGPPSENAWVTTVREVVSQIVEVPKVDVVAPGPYRYSDANKLVTLLDSSGFGALEVKTWRGALPMGDASTPEEAAQFAISSLAAFADLLAKSGQSALDEALRALTAILTEHQRTRGLQMDASVHIVTGAKR